MLAVILILGGTVTLLVRSGNFSLGGLLQVPNDTPACPASLNRWADQRLAALRLQLQQEHGLYRADGKALNAIGVAMNWIDDRIIDQRVGEERQQLRRSLLASSRCLVQFQP